MPGTVAALACVPRVRIERGARDGGRREAARESHAGPAPT
jgi:hypothetical protein